MAVSTLPRVNTTPASYDEVFKDYYDYVVNLVAKLGIDRQNAEDAAMSILMKFIERDALGFFDPKYSSTHSGKVYPAAFRTFLSGFVATYVKHYVDRQHVTAAREKVILDQPVTAVYGSDNTVLRDYLQEPLIEEFEDLHVEDLLNRIHVRLATTAPRNSQDNCDLPVFFSAVLAQIDRDGCTNVAELALQFGKSKNTIQTWLKRLRAEVAEVAE